MTPEEKKEYMREYRKKHYAANSDKYKANAKRYVEENRQKVLDSRKKYRDKNKEKILEAQRIYRENNKEKIKESARLAHLKRKESGKVKKYIDENRESILEKQREYNRKNSDKRKEWKKKYRAENKEAIREYKRKKLEDPVNRLVSNLGRSLRGAFLRNGTKKKSKKFEILGYSKEDFTKHMLKTLSDLNKISSTKYKKSDIGSTLHIEHIVPVSKFDFNSIDHPELKRCYALENLRLWPAKDFIDKNGNVIEGNLSKRAKCENFQMSVDQLIGAA